MDADRGDSSFLSPARSEAEEIRRDLTRVGRSPVFEAMLVAAEGSVAILNDRREVLAVNDRFLSDLGLNEPAELLGLRLGEALRCVYSDLSAGGCGTSEYCPSCGMAIAVVGTLVREKVEQRRCHLRIERQDGTKDDRCLAIRGVPLPIGRRRYVAVFIGDITREERRAAFEKCFLHDLNNILTSLSGIAQLRRQTIGDGEDGFQEELEQIAARLQRETDLQRLLVEGTPAGLATRRDELDPALVCARLERLVAAHPAARGRRLLTRIDAATEDKIVTDSDLLERALLNLLINACEATPEGGEVGLAIVQQPRGWQFSVHNPAYLAPPVARRVFQRHFSTKPGEGRGFGTFGARLVAQTLLGGSLEFTSSRQGGTTFKLSIPRSG